MKLSDDFAALVGFGCEAGLWGMYCVVFLGSLTTLRLRRKLPRVPWPIILANCVLFLLATAHYALDFSHFYSTLSTTGVRHFAKGTRLLVSTDLLTGLTDFVGTSILVYRCWLAWGRRYSICIFSLTLTAAGFDKFCLITLVLFQHIRSVCVFTTAIRALTLPPAAPHMSALGTTGAVLFLCSNATSTGLITAGMLRDLRSFRTPARRHRCGHESMCIARRAGSIFIESGVLCLVAHILFISFYATTRPAWEVVSGATVQLYAIAPTLIIIRTGLGKARDQNTSTSEVQAYDEDSHWLSSIFFTSIPGAQSNIEPLESG